MKPLLDDEKKRNDPQAIKECYNQIQKLFDGKSRRAKSASQSQGSDSGEFRKKFAQVRFGAGYLNAVYFRRGLT